MPLSLVQATPVSRRVALLRHAPDPGGPPPHFDLLVEPAGLAEPETRDVPTWRCHRRPDRLGVGEEITATPIAPHRRWWLDRPPGEVVTLRPPLGTAAAIRHGRLLDALPPTAAGDPIDLEIAWEGDISPMRIRIETSGPSGARIGRRRRVAGDLTNCCGEAGSCC